MSWKPLDLRSRTGDLPPILVKAEFTTNSYAIFITDTTHIWHEELDRRGIIRRALDENTSIDPSEDPDQMRQFLHKLRLAVEGDHGTSLRLEASGKQTAGQTAKELLLTLTAELPHGFEPLTWPVQLRLQEQTTHTIQFIMPLLKAEYAHLHELDSLVDVLKDKDHVIQKLADKVETMGAELGTIFAGASKRGGKVTREWQEERIKGLRPFDRDSWKKSLKNRSEAGTSLHEAVQSIFTGNTGDFSTADAELGSQDWWNKLEDLVTDDKPTKQRKPVVRSSTPPEEQAKGDGDDDEDDFQVQSTPPHLMNHEHGQKTPSKTSANVDENETTEDEDDLDSASQSQASKIPDSFNQPVHPSTKMETNEALKRSIPEPKPSFNLPDNESATEDEDVNTTEKPKVTTVPTSTTKPKSTGLGKIGGKKPDPETDAESDASPSPQPLHKPRKGGLGKIGGKKKYPQPHSPPSPSSPVQEKNTVLPRREPRAKLGIIGRRSAEPDQVASQTGSSGSQTIAGDEAREGKDKTPEVEETSEEKANRKRAELKRVLEEKAKAPVKKKRKF